MNKYFDNKINSLDELKKEYKRLAFLHHPDRGGLTEIMQEINNEYDKLFEQLKHIQNNETTANGEKKYKQTSEMSADYREVILKIIILDDVIIELCGSWLWLSGKTYTHRNILKEIGFDWSKSKKMWYWRPDAETSFFYRGRKTIDAIRKSFGSEIIQGGKLHSIGGAV